MLSPSGKLPTCITTCSQATASFIQGPKLECSCDRSSSLDGATSPDHGAECLTRRDVAHHRSSRSHEHSCIRYTSNMARIRMTRIALFLGLSTISLALEVSPNSPCAAKCIDDPRTGDVANRSSSLTFSTDLFCYDWEVVGSNSTQNGQKMKDCNNCLKSSGYGSEAWPETDRGWFMCKWF